MNIAPPSADALPEKSWTNFTVDAQDREAVPVLLPLRYVNSLGIDIKVLAQNARVTVDVVLQTLHLAYSQMHLRKNLRIIKAANEVCGKNLRSMRSFRIESSHLFGPSTVPQAKNLWRSRMQLIEPKVSKQLKVA